MPPIRAYIPTAAALAATVIVTGAGISHTLAQRADRLSREEAIATVVSTNPDLVSYTTVDSPQLAIETKETPVGWHIAFVKKQKNAETIAEATCYYTTTGGTVSAVGTYAPDQEGEPFSFDDCVSPVEEVPRLLSGKPLTVQPTQPPKPVVETCSCPQVQNTCARWTTCVRAPGGQCVVKQTPELTACLANPQYANL